MRVFILALDGLEYDYVIKWNLKNLMQKTFGKFEISPNYFTFEGGVAIPYSPLVWASFITGVPPESHNVNGFWQYDNKILEIVRKFPLILKIRGKRRILSRTGITPNLQRVKQKTIFEKVNPSIAIDVVGYNANEKTRKMMFKIKSIDEFITISNKFFLAKIDYFWTLVDEPWKLFMYYINHVDHMSHCTELTKLKYLYQYMDYFAKKIKNHIKNHIGDCIFLIVSDHGFEKTDKYVGVANLLKGPPQVHSKHAFYSLNINTKWKPNHVTDFMPRILEWVSSYVTT